MLRTGAYDYSTSSGAGMEHDSGSEFGSAIAGSVQLPLPIASAPPPVEHPANWLLMLDVDGTLLDIAHRPDAVAVPLSLKETLLELYQMLSGALVLVSGRSIAEMDALFAPLRFPAAGLHGGEQRLSGKNIRRLFPDAREKIEALAQSCRRFAMAWPRVLVEQKPLSVALHYRMNPEAEPKIRAKSEALAKSLGWKVLHGKMVCEIQPAGFDKGMIVKKLARLHPARKPVYVGDDVTDEPALQAANALQGYAIRVGKPAGGGMYGLDTPVQVREWLLKLAGYGNSLSYAQPLRRPDISRSLAQDAGRILVVSNRVSMGRGHKANAGGLAVAMGTVLREHGGVWIGWSGKISDTSRWHAQQEDNVTYLVQDLTQQDHDRFYMQFCNATLWPLLHYNIALSDFDRTAYETYQRVNRRYAELLKSKLKPNDTIWVHDFHFIPLAQHLRRLGVRNRIGFFLHTPFPTREVLLTLPVHKELMSALYAYDVAGFQTQRDLDAFHSYANARNILPASRDAMQPDTLFAHFPIGIETQEFADNSRKALRSKEARDLKASLDKRTLIIGVDRLDYSKGIMQRLKAVDDVLGRNGRWQKQFTFLQISPPTREGLEEYAQLRQEVESLVGHVNGKYAHVDWVPIRFLAQGIKREHLAAFYRMARIGLVTPLRDGMNLIAKEFVAAQDPEDPGVLVLSRFAGAAEELREALLVNPHDTHEIADAIEQALLMPLAERKARWQAMYETISTQTLEKWYLDYLGMLTGHQA